MKSFAKSLKRQDGFTLVELMVVVAIIGLLSAVAIPNFKKYQAKAKMSEAKLQLSAAYTAQSAFFSDFNMYGYCLAYMGFDPNAEAGNRYYAIGFSGVGIHSAIDGQGTPSGAYGSAVNSGLMANDCMGTFSQLPGVLPYVSQNATLPNTNQYWAAKGIGSAVANTVGFLPTTGLGTQENTQNMTFIIGAGGVIDGAATSIQVGTNSQLAINERKIISVVRNGF